MKRPRPPSGRSTRPSAPPPVAAAARLSKRRRRGRRRAARGKLPSCAAGRRDDASRRAAATAGRRPDAGAARRARVESKARPRPRADAPRQRGTVLWFEASKKHGFIQSEGARYFRAPVGRQRALGEGDLVEFSVSRLQGPTQSPRCREDLGPPPPAKVERVQGRCLWYDSTRKMGFLKGKRRPGDLLPRVGRQRSRRALGRATPSSRRRVCAICVNFNGKSKADRREVCGTGAAAATAAAAADHRQHHRPTLGRRGAGARVPFHSIRCGRCWLDRGPATGCRFNGKRRPISSNSRHARRGSQEEMGRVRSPTVRQQCRSCPRSTTSSWPELTRFSVPRAGHVPARDG